MLYHISASPFQSTSTVATIFRHKRYHISVIQNTIQGEKWSAYNLFQSLLDCCKIYVQEYYSNVSPWNWWGGSHLALPLYKPSPTTHLESWWQQCLDATEPRGPPNICCSWAWRVFHHPLLVQQYQELFPHLLLLLQQGPWRLPASAAEGSGTFPSIYCHSRAQVSSLTAHHGSQVPPNK